MFWLRNKKNNFEIRTLIEVECCILLQVVILTLSYLEHSGSVVECLTGDREAAGSSLTGITALWSLSKTYLS